jgi:site-specific DNA-methyltransferase (adenine-specific)
MFIRKKGNRFYLVENRRVNGKVRQKVIQYLGVNPNSKDEYLPKFNVIYSCKVEEFLKKLPDNSCDCIIADPPYFVSCKREFSVKNGKNKIRDFGDWDYGDYKTFFDRWMYECFRVLKHNLFLFTRDTLTQYFSEKFNKYYKCSITWHKSNPLPHFLKNNFISSCETILFFQKQEGLFNFLSHNEMHNFIETPIEQRKGIRFHPTQKHEKVIEWLMKIGSNKNSLVLDLFSGSGTTSRVAKKMQRHFIGVEQDVKFVRKARKSLCK